MAKAKEHSKIIEALGRYQRQGGLDDQPLLAKTIAGESHRGIVVIVGSVTEDLLLEQILKRLQPLSNERQKAMIRGGGALSTWAHLINVAVGLGIIDDDDAGQLELLKTMRNACSHSRRHIDFNTPELKEALALLMPTLSLAREVRRTTDKNALAILLSRPLVYLWCRIRGQTKAVAKKRVQELIAEGRAAALRRATSPQKPTQPPKINGGGAPTD